MKVKNIVRMFMAFPILAFSSSKISATCQDECVGGYESFCCGSICLSGPKACKSKAMLSGKKVIIDKKTLEELYQGSRKL